MAFIKLLMCLRINCTASLIAVSLFCHIMFKAEIHVWAFFFIKEQKKTNYINSKFTSH